MSRIGKIPISVSKEVKVTLEKNTVVIEGPKGKLSLNLPEAIGVEQKNGEILVRRLSATKQSRADHGTTRALLVNMIEGVTKGHKKELEIQGVGFRAQVQGQKFTVTVGFSHPVEFTVPAGVKVTTPKPTEIIVEGLNKALVGEVAANIRNLKPPEPYKGKGIRYFKEAVRRKQGKSVTK